jgi:hypothetical protein
VVADALGCGEAHAGYVVHTFVYYWWPTAGGTRSGCFGAGCTRCITGPQRIEVVTSFYKHPIEILLNGFISSVVLYVVVVGARSRCLRDAGNGMAELLYH